MSGLVDIHSILFIIWNNGLMVFVDIIRYHLLLMLMWMTFHWEVDRCEWNGGNPLNIHPFTPTSVRATYFLQPIENRDNI